VLFLIYWEVITVSTQQQSLGCEFGKRERFNLLFLLAYAHAFCILPFIRRNFGVEGLRYCFLSAIMIWLYTGFARAPEMLTYGALWLVFVILQRLRTWTLVRQGRVLHSRYAGDSMVLFVRKADTARLLEMLFCAVAGGLLSQYVSPALGKFVGAGFFSLMFIGTIEVQITRRRVQQMRDAEIEQRYVSDLYRGRRSDS